MSLGYIDLFKLVGNIFHGDFEDVLAAPDFSSKRNFLEKAYDSVGKIVLKQNEKVVNIKKIEDLDEKDNVYLYLINNEYTLAPSFISATVPKDQQNYVLVYDRFDTIDELIAKTELVHTKNRIVGLIIGMHGNVGTFYFHNRQDTHTECLSNFFHIEDSKTIYSKEGNLPRLEKALNCVDENGTIALFICHAAETLKRSRRPSMAQSISELAEGRLVIACDREASFANSEIIADGKGLTFRFYKSYRSDSSGIISEISNTFYHLLSQLGLFKVNGTVEFKSDEEYDFSTPPSSPYSTAPNSPIVERKTISESE